MIILFSFLAGVLYRAGGCWQTKIRDLGVPLLCYLPALWFLHLWHWGWCLLSAMLLFASLTTYWKKKGEDAKWWNWLLTGIGYGVASLPLLAVGVSWWAFLLRTAVLGLSVMAWSEVISIAWLEEFGRGFLIIATLPLLCL
jgi:hypothetical protein